MGPPQLPPPQLPRLPQSPPPPPLPPPPPRRFSAKERKALLAHLDGTKFGGNQHLVLTKNQKLALEQEKEFQGKGFAPFSSDSDPPPPPPPRQPNQIELFLSQLPE